jgi:hypothetical protein
MPSKKVKFMRYAFNRILTFYLIRKGLLAEIEKLKKNTKLELSWEEYHDINRAWYKKKNYFIIMDYQILSMKLLQQENMATVLSKSMSKFYHDDYHGFDNKRRKKKTVMKIINKKRPNRLC